MARVGSSDRNFYDRCYFNAHDRTGEHLSDHRAGRVSEPRRHRRLCAAYAAAIQQRAVRFSDALRPLARPAGRAYRVEVIEPLRRVRIVCDARGIWAFDLTWDGSFPP